MSLRNHRVFLPATQGPTNDVPDVFEAGCGDGLFRHHLSRMASLLQFRAYPLISTASPLI